MESWLNKYTEDSSNIEPKGLSKPSKSKDVRKKGQTLVVEPMKELGHTIKRNIPVSNTPFNYSEGPTQNYTNARKDFVDWYSNPETLKRFEKNTGFDPGRIRDMVGKAVATPAYSSTAQKQPPVGVKAVFRTLDTAPQEEIVYHDNNVKTGTIQHELTHAGGIANVLGPALLRTLGSPYKQTLPSDINDPNFKSTGNKIREYMSIPYEAYGNFHEFRTNLGLKPGQKIDVNTLRKLVKDKNLQAENFYNTFEDENIVKAINTIAYNPEQTDEQMQYAQDGAMIRYKNGLDFTPRSMQRGGNLIKDERAQAINAAISTNVKRPNFDLERQKVRKTNITEKSRRASLSKAEREREDYNATLSRHGSMKKFEPESTIERIDNIALNPLTAAGYALRNESLPPRFQLGERSNLDMATDVINPMFYINQAEGLVKNTGKGTIELLKGNGQNAYDNFIDAGLNAASIVPLGLEAGALINKIPAVKTINQASSLREALGTFGGIPTAKSLPRLSKEELKAFRQVQELGRIKATSGSTAEQYKYALAQNIPDEHLQKVFRKTRAEIEAALPEAEQAAAIRERSSGSINLRRDPRGVNSNGQIRHQLYDDLDDYEMLNDELPPIADELILDITNGTRRPGRGRTIIGMNPRRTSLSDSFREKTDEVFNQFNYDLNNKISELASSYPYYKGPVLETVPSLSLKQEKSLKNVADKVTLNSKGVSPGDVFTGSLNTSHNSYLPQIKQVFKYEEGAPKFLGYKEMNDLGYLSDYRYSKDDIAAYLNSEIDQQIARKVLPKNIQRPYVRENEVILPQYGVQQNYSVKQNGGVINDDMGQWKYPGEITRINSNQITMEGVDYPVLGVSDTGDTKMMYPNGNYKFKGKSVTEYPMAQNGLRQEQKGLKNLDDLLNFTNYNNAQSGGWLKKYES